MVIIFEHYKKRYSGRGWIDNISATMSLVKSGAEAAVPIAQTGKIIKETVDLYKGKVDLNPNTLFANTQAILKQRDLNKDDILAKIRENIEKKKSGSGFVKVDSI